MIITEIELSLKVKPSSSTSFHKILSVLLVGILSDHLFLLIYMFWEDKYFVEYIS